MQIYYSLFQSSMIKTLIITIVNDIGANKNDIVENNEASPYARRCLYQLRLTQINAPTNIQTRIKSIVSSGVILFMY
jgi:hypothetical protein